MIRLTISGEAVAQGRPRAVRRGNSVRLYDPAKSRNYKAYVRMTAALAYKGALLDGEIALKIAIYRLPPQSWSKAKTALALAGGIRPATKPDLTNSAKGIEDALNGLIWRDDAQIVHLELDKFYAAEPRVEITVKKISA